MPASNFSMEREPCLELPKPVRSNVIDIVAALQESLAQKKPRKRRAA
jgi:non-homologous end joining protein Ku